MRGMRRAVGLARLSFVLCRVGDEENAQVGLPAMLPSGENEL